MDGSKPHPGTLVSTKIFSRGSVESAMALPTPSSPQGDDLVYDTLTRYERIKERLADWHFRQPSLGS